MPLLLAGLPVHLALGLVSAVVAVLSSALLLWRRSSSKPAAGTGTGATATKKQAGGLQASKANGSVKQIEDPSLLDPSKPCCRILYGTQTGTAERFAKQLGKDLKKKFGDSTIIDVVDIENYRAAERLPNERLVLFCMATYGDGEPTDNAADFYSWLVKEGAAVSDGEKEPYLKAVQYAVFGLGNKQYEHFNKMGRQVHKLMGLLGATPLLRAGEGDDDGSIDDDFDKWCVEFHAALDAKPDLLGAAKGGDGAAEPPAAVPAYEVQLAAAGSNAAPAFPPGTGLEAHHPLTARVALVRELYSPASERACVHVEVDIAGSQLTYTHGDHLAVHAQNAPEVVQEVANMLGTDLDTVITLRKPSASAPSAAGLADPPCRGPVTLRTLLSYFADVTSSPHRDALLALASVATNPDEAARLTRLASPAGKDEYVAYIGKVHRSLLEVMRDFPSARPSLGVFFGGVAPRLQPRFYSISSSPALHPTTVHLTVAVVKDIMPTGRVHNGIASSWLQGCASSAGTSVPVFVRHSHFKLPKDPSTAVIMVGPGTGLAPFRGFLQERAVLQKSGAKLGRAVLFYGCRNRQHDYLYQEELSAYLQQGIMTDLHVAFSREGATKDYVQHHMERQAGALWELLSGGAHLYVCGDAKAMARDVHRALLALVQKGKGCSGTQAEAWVKELQDSGRYQRDVW